MPDTGSVIRAFGFLSILLLASVIPPVGFTQDGESASTSPFAGFDFVKSCHKRGLILLTFAHRRRRPNQL